MSICLMFILQYSVCLQKSVPNAKIGFSKAMQAGWVTMDKKTAGGPKLQKKVRYSQDFCLRPLQEIYKLYCKVLATYVFR